MSRIAVVGSINFDVILQLDVPLDRHFKRRAAFRAEAVGGSAANTARWLAADGHAVTLYSSVGSDDVGSYCLNQLSLAGIEVEHVMRVPGSTSSAVCITSPVDKVIITHHDGDSEDTAVEVRGSSGFDHVHIAARDHNKQAAGLLRDRHPESTVSLELNGRRSSLFARHADVIFSNADDLRVQQLNVHVASRLLSDIGATSGACLVLTNGPKGSVCLPPDKQLVTVPAETATRIVDRTGAGDAFNAGFLTEWLKNEPVQGCLRRGQSFAADCIGRVGGGP